MESRLLAYHIDLKRPMWRAEYFERMGDVLNGWGFNHVLYEPEDKFRFRNHPALWHSDAPAHDQTAGIVASLRRRNIEVIPLVQTLGHAEYVVGKEQYAHLRESPDHRNQYDPLSDQVRAMLIEMIDEVIEVVRPREFFHIGGDETWSLGQSPKCAELLHKIGVGGIYARHMGPLWEHVHKRGLRPIIWADIVLAHPQVLPHVPPYVVMMDWDYWTGANRWAHFRHWGLRRQLNWEQYQQLGDKDFHSRLGRFLVDEHTKEHGIFHSFGYAEALKSMGFGVITASAARSWGDTMGIPNNAEHLPNIFYSARKGATHLGNCVTSWAVRHSHPETSLLGAFTAHYASRTNGEIDGVDLGRAFTLDFFGVQNGDFAAAVEKAHIRVPMSESWQIFSKGIDAFDPADNRDRFAEMFDAADKCPGGRPAFRMRMEDALTGYRQARKTFLQIQKDATKNAFSLDFWIEGVDLLIFYAQLDLDVLMGKIRQTAGAHLLRLAELRLRTARLFSQTYSAGGVNAELAMRYGFHEKYLKSMA